jgi:hypothetical protein
MPAVPDDSADDNAVAYFIVDLHDGLTTCDRHIVEVGNLLAVPAKK